MKQSIQIIRAKTAPQPVKRAPAETLDFSIEATVHAAFRSLSEGQSFILCGESAEGLTRTIKALAKQHGRRVVCAPCAHPVGEDDRQDTIRVWFTDSPKAKQSRGKQGRRDTAPPTKQGSLTFEEWMLTSYAEDARIELGELGDDATEDQLREYFTRR